MKNRIYKNDEVIEIIDIEEYSYELEDFLIVSRSV